LGGTRIQSLSDARTRGGGAGGCLRRELAWLLAAKFAALGLLWLLFFSAAHQPAIDASIAGRQLAVAASAPGLTSNEPHIQTLESTGD
jgi:hypothetical protein